MKKIENPKLTEDQKKLIESEGYTFVGFHRKGSKNAIYIQLKHNLCGKIMDTRKERFFVNGNRCRCQQKKELSFTTKTFQDEINSRYNNEYTIIGNFLGRKKPLTLQHNCGYQYTIQRAEFLISKKPNGGKCPICSNRTRNTTEILNKRFQNFGLNIELAESFVTNRNIYKIKDNRCGHVYEKDYVDIINTKRCNCPICNKRDLESVKKEFESKDPDYILIDTEYKDTHTPMKVYHKKCKNTYFVSRTNFLYGRKCPFCNMINTTSSGEKEVKSFLLNSGISCKKIKRKNIDEGKYLEVDIFNEERNIGIEYDGLYWHSDAIKENDYHIKKTNFFYSQGIRLIHIFEDEWLNKQDIVKDKLQSILGIQKEKIYARKCEMKEVSTKIRNEFLAMNHIQGSDLASISYGLYYNNDLVAIMSLSKLGKKSGVYELSRYCSKLGYTVIGGFSKLLSNICELKTEIREITAYANLRWVDRDKNVYLTNGFVLSNILEPSYYYLDNKHDKCEPRSRYRKSELKTLFPDIYDEKLSEREIMSKAGYYRIYDCGNLVYKKKIRD